MLHCLHVLQAGLLTLLLLGGGSAFAQSGRGSVRTYGQAEIVAAYADALRYFNHALTEEDAKSIADQLATEARRQGVDARIVVAVLASDGTLDTAKRVRRGDSTDLQLEGRPYRVLITLLTKEIASRNAEHAKGREFTQEILRLTLVDHAKARKNAASSPAQHADKTLKLYRQLCGTE